MAVLFQIRRDTETGWTGVVLAANEPGIVYHDSAPTQIKALIVGDGSTAAEDLIADARALAPLYDPEFVNNVTIVANALAGQLGVGASADRFTNQKAFVAGRMASRIRAARGHRVNDVVTALTAGVFSPITFDSISSGFNSNDVMQATSWLNVANGKFTPTAANPDSVPGFWLVTATVRWTLSSATAPVIDLAIARNGTVVSQVTPGTHLNFSTLTYSATIVDVIHLDGAHTSPQYLEVGLVSDLNISPTVIGGATKTFFTATYINYGTTGPT